MGVGCHHHWEGGTETVPLWERQNGAGYNQPVKGGGGPPQPPDGGGGGIGPPLSGKGVKGHLSDCVGRGGAPLPGGNGDDDDNGGG